MNYFRRFVVALWALVLIGSVFVASETQPKSPFKPEGKRVDPAEQARVDAGLRDYSAKGDLIAVRKYLAKGADTNSVNNGGGTALMEASHHGFPDVARELLRAGAKVDTRNNDGGTALQIAAWNGWTEIVKLLLANGAVPDTINKYGFSDLMGPAENGHKEIVEALIQAGADVNAVSKNGDTAVGWACKGDFFKGEKTEAKRKEILSMLVQAGARPPSVKEQEGICEDAALVASLEQTFAKTQAAGSKEEL